MSQERLDDMPAPMRWTLIFIKQVGFPIVVCIWLAYQQFVAAKETVRALQDFKEVMTQVKDSIDAQNRILKRRPKAFNEG